MRHEEKRNGKGLLSNDIGDFSSHNFGFYITDGFRLRLGFESNFGVRFSGQIVSRLRARFKAMWLINQVELD